MEGSKRTSTRSGDLSSLIFNKKQTQKKQQQKNPLMTESLLSNNTSNCCKLIVTPTGGETYGLRRRNGTITLP